VFAAALGRDLLYSCKLPAQSPAFASAAVVSLALGIGANTAIFSILNSLLLKPLLACRRSALRFLDPPAQPQSARGDGASV
jgi:hypothetical protein